MIWIEERKTIIPKKLYYHSYQTDKDEDGQTPLMLWIIYGRGKDIPNYLLYPGW